MFLFFFPPVVQALIGVVLLVIGLTLVHSVIFTGVGLVDVAIGGVRYVRSRRPNGSR